MFDPRAIIIQAQRVILLGFTDESLCCIENISKCFTKQYRTTIIGRPSISRTHVLLYISNRNKKWKLTRKTTRKGCIIYHKKH